MTFHRVTRCLPTPAKYRTWRMTMKFQILHTDSWCTDLSSGPSGKWHSFRWPVYYTPMLGMNGNGFALCDQHAEAVTRQGRTPYEPRSRPWLARGNFLWPCTTANVCGQPGAGVQDTEAPTIALSDLGERPHCGSRRSECISALVCDRAQQPQRVTACAM
jgi:hypothetical protein